MRLKLTLLSALLLYGASVIASEKPDCGSAVDAADRLAPASDEGCDYTKTGLNGVLHKALSGKADSAEDSKEVIVKDANEKNEPAVIGAVRQGKSEFSSASQLQSLKFVLLEKIALECVKGFVVESERYLPTATKTLKLELIYHCL